MASGEWGFVDSGARSGEFNMALDEALARRLQSGQGLPLFRLFRWSPWAISLGYNQKPEDIDAAACRRDGIDVVRRPTGGRAILHAEELTYSVVMFAGRRSVLDIYNAISRALVRGLAFHGVAVGLQKSQPNFPEAYRHVSSIPCFTSSARYEIEWRGRKLVGSAQRRFSGGVHDVVLQHGSILCGPAHLDLADYVRVEGEPLQDRLRQEMVARTVDLSEIEQHPVDLHDLAASLRKGFEVEWGIRFTELDAGTIAGTVVPQGVSHAGRRVPAPFMSED